MFPPKVINHFVSRLTECPPLCWSSVNKFKSLEKSKLVDTGNLWMNLKVVKRLVETNGQNVENYPLSKSFDCAIGVNVPHSRFQPMMSTSDLFIFQSDLYSMLKAF